MAVTAVYTTKAKGSLYPRARTQRVSSFMNILKFVVFLGLATGQALLQSRAQELLPSEELPQVATMKAVHGQTTLKTLKMGAQEIWSQWQALHKPGARQNFNAYFDIFSKLAQLEGREKASQLIGIAPDTKLANMTKDILKDLKTKGLTAQKAGLAGINLLATGQFEHSLSGDLDLVKARYTLILDYLQGMEAVHAGSALLDHLAKSGHPQLAFEIFNDFIVNDASNLETARERSDRLDIALGDAAVIGKPQASLTLLTKMLFEAPRHERNALVQRAIDRIDFKYVKNAHSAIDAEEDLLTSVWFAAVKIHRGEGRDIDREAIFKQTAARLDPTPFYFWVASLRDKTERNNLVHRAVHLNLQQGYSLRAYSVLLGSDLPVSDCVDLMLDLIARFSKQHYDLYAKDLAQNLLASLKNGTVKLNAAQIQLLFASLDKTDAVPIIKAFAAQVKGFEQIKADSIARSVVLSAFHGRVDKPLGAQALDIPTHANRALAAAALLVGGSTVDEASLGIRPPPDAQSIAFLQQIAKRVWTYPNRRDAIINVVTSPGDLHLRTTIALGASGSDAFAASGDFATRLIAGIKRLLAHSGNRQEPVLPDNSRSRLLLSASSGVTIADKDMVADVRVRRARFLASFGRFSQARALADTARTEMVKNAIEESLAVFDTPSAMQDSLAKLPDYLERVKRLRTLAENRAAFLDHKSWLNSAKPVSKKATSQEVSFGKSVIFSNGQLNVTQSARDQVPDTRRPFMPNLLLRTDVVTRTIPVTERFYAKTATASLSRRGETPRMQLAHFSAEHFDSVNLDIRKYLYLSAKTSKIMDVTHGVMTIGALVAQIRAIDPDAIAVKAGVVTLNRPLVIDPGATLIVSGKEIRELRLNTTKGAFLINSGNIYFDHVVVSSYDETTKKPSYVWDYKKGHYFRPFIASLSGSRTYSTNSHFIALGYSGGKTYGMSLSTGSLTALHDRDNPAAPTGSFINNSFDNLYYGFYTFAAKDIIYVGNELVNGVVYGLDPHGFSKNLMMAYNSAHGTQNKHGIILSREVNDSFIIGNLSFRNHGTGIMLDRKSSGTIVYANDASRNHGDGFSTLESPCTLIDSNVFAYNARVGVKIRNSWNILVNGNQIIGNQAAGLEGYIDNLKTANQSKFRNFTKDAYYPFTTFSAQNNLIKSNRIGMVTHGITAATFYHNRFVDQLPKYTSGDIKPFSLAVVAGSMDKDIRVQSVCLPKAPKTPHCLLIDTAVISSQTDYVKTEATSGARAFSNHYCVDSLGTPQARAFAPGAGE